MKTFTKRLLTNQTKQTQTTESVHVTTTSSLSRTNLPPTVDYFRFLYVSSSSVKTPLSWLFSNCSKDSLYPTSRSRLSCNWRCTELVFPKVTPQSYQPMLRWWGSEYCLVRLIGQTHLFLKVILITRCLLWVYRPLRLSFQHHLLQPGFWNSWSTLHVTVTSPNWGRTFDCTTHIIYRYSPPSVSLPSEWVSSSLSCHQSVSQHLFHVIPWTLSPYYHIPVDVWSVPMYHPFYHIRSNELYTESSSPCHHHPGCENPHQFQQSVRESFVLNHLSGAQIHSSSHQNRMLWFLDHLMFCPKSD